MLLSDTYKIGGKLLAIRKKAGLTQMEVAEAAGLSSRAYADIERGSVNMRVETVIKICAALHITPDEILTADNETATMRQDEILARLNACSTKDRETALQLLAVFLHSLTE